MRLPFNGEADDVIATAVRFFSARCVSTVVASNENSNGLLRHYFPRNADLSICTRAELNAVARQLNNRPRQTLNWMKPSEVFGRIVASTS